MGGGGYVLALLIGITLFSKSPSQKALARISLPMSCFNISEPVVFGLPIMLNPSLLIPFLVVEPTICVTVAIITGLG
ncbi:MAG: PTS transporter subunit EIIC [Breznakia sp.]